MNITATILEQSSDFGFVVGGGDTCQVGPKKTDIFMIFFLKGDSGGPLIKWLPINGVETAFLIGVVSRGELCGRPNRAGIYTRVKTALKWIFSHASDGKCGLEQGGDGQRLISVRSRTTTTTTTKKTPRSTQSTRTSSTSTTTDPSLVYPQVFIKN